MFIELQDGTKIIKLEKIDKISLVKDQIEFVYVNENNNVYVVQHYGNDKRAREVYEDLKNFINWKPFLTLHSNEREVDFKKIVEEIENKTKVKFGLVFNNLEEKLNPNAIFTMPSK